MSKPNEQQDPAIGPIVVGTDGSDLSFLAVGEAGAIARRFNRHLIVVFVRRLRSMENANNDAAYLEDALDACEVIAQARVIAILDGLDVSWSFRVRSGRPAEELMKVATTSKATMIVIARHSAVDRRRLFIGTSVTRRLLSRWPYSLLVLWPLSEEVLATGSSGRHFSADCDGLWFNCMDF